MTAGELSQWIREQGRALGFDRVGIAAVGERPELEFFPQWKRRGYAGALDYLHEPKREDVRKLMAEARSVICCALVYNTAAPYSTQVPQDGERGWVSRYAWGDDYHELVEAKLEALRAAIRGNVGEDFAAKLYVDTGPVLERVYGKYAGLGWIAKNTCLLDAEMGSWFFLGVLVTNLALEPDAPLPDGCGSCTVCLEACPTGALEPARPYVMDARRCLSYLTIELRAAIPEELRAPLGRHVFGCDICQDVCPYNQKPWLTELAAFAPREMGNRETRTGNRKEEKDDSRSTGHPSRAGQAPSPAAPAAGQESRLTAPSPVAPATGEDSLFHPRLDWLAALSQEDFRRIFRHSAIKRAKWRGLLRNVLVAMGNSAPQSGARFRPILEKFARGSDPLLAEHARWALRRLPPAAASGRGSPPSSEEVRSLPRA